ncbi:MAG: DNA mismatch repair endonuclease MutL [Christensenellales bacterium]|nr:DNA mismatch repair endonuclease MutL [Christensenellales bacterium]
MGRINLLGPGVFNMISAGEVVERPSSVVKELVENSIDAGATEISVFVEDGGIRRISVSDNGSGILKDDMRAAFLPHATSKLCEIADLDTIATLGFRGEALASIASVSEVTLVSRADGADAARKIILEAGKVTEESEDSRAKGTSVTVENLFFNTPARLKFLKKASTEQGYVEDAVEKIVLANPSLKITLTSEKGVLLAHDGGNLADAMADVYPHLDMSRFIAVDRVSSSGVRVSGYVSAVDYTAPTRSRQTVIVNGRVVENDTVSAAVDKAYRDYLVKRTFPMYVLDVIVPFDEVDVNVHPAKAEVRFRNKNAVFGAVFRAVDEAIKASFGSEKHGFSPVSTGSADAAATYEQTAIDTAALFGDMPENTSSDRLGAKENPVRDLPFNLGSLRGIGVSRAGRAAEKRIPSYEIDGAHLYGGMPAEGKDDLYDDAYALSKISEDEDKDFANSSNTRFRLFDGEVVGQVFDTYLIVERADVVYVIDQHAAHERVLYDKLSASLSSEFSQSLLIPYKLRLSGAEEEYFDKIMPALNDMGFAIEKKPGSYLVYAVPEPVVRMNIEKFVAALFENMLDDGELKLTDLLKDVVCRDACRAAIKGGEHLTRRQIEYVLSNLIDEEGNLPQKCPHGRPAVVALTKRDFEKMFMRVVG